MGALVFSPDGVDALSLDIGGTDPVDGLTRDEAHERLLRFGRNVLPNVRRRRLVTQLLLQVGEPRELLAREDSLSPVQGDHVAGLVGAGVAHHVGDQVGQLVVLPETARGDPPERLSSC